MDYGVYIHIPFCKRKCFYCDFPSEAGKEGQMKDYVRALVKEIQTVGRAAANENGMPRTIYIGGGTPSIFSRPMMENVLCAVCEVFLKKKAMGKNRQDFEFTVECNPGTVSLDKLRSFRLFGVNRLSLGTQSFQDRLLKKIGRIHTSAETVEAVQAARRAGFTNISLDLMYALPGETLMDFECDLASLVALHPSHISVYGLILEHGTMLEKLVLEGRVFLPNEDENEAMYDLMTAYLPRHGYERYEISSFSKRGFESRHNLSYWQDIPYLGLGVAAHSYIGGRRYENLHGIEAYIRAIESGTVSRLKEAEYSEKIHMEEFAFLALRTVKGLSKEAFRKSFGVSVENVYRKVMEDMMEKGLLEEKNGFLRLTEQGMKFGNVVFEAFLLD